MVSLARLLAVVTIASAVAECRLMAQVVAHADSAVRVIVPSASGDHIRTGRRLSDAVHRQPPFPGLPPRSGLTDQVTVTVTDSLGRGEDAIAVPDQRLVLLNSARLEEAPEGWDTLLRHELAHLALFEAVRGRRVPEWFDEGYAIWVSGGLSCRASLRIRLAIVTDQEIFSLQFLTIPRHTGRLSRRLVHDLYGTALEFLHAAVGDQGIAQIVAWTRIAGFDEAFRRVWRRGHVASFEQRWQRYVTEHFSSLPSEFSCSGP